MKLFLNISFILLGCLLFFEGEAQNPRKLKPLGAGFRYSTTLVGDPAYIMASVNYFVIPQLETELNIGYQYLSAGGKYHLNRKTTERPFTPYAGILLGLQKGTGISQFMGGVKFLSLKGFSASASINGLLFLEYDRYEWLFSLTAGWHFKIRK